MQRPTINVPPYSEKKNKLKNLPSISRNVLDSHQVGFVKVPAAQSEMREEKK